MPDIVTLLLIPFVSGTVGGFLINWFLERIRAKERRKSILNSLHSQVKALKRINIHNQTATEPPTPPQHLLPIPYPTIPFETAIFSENGISVNDDTIQAITDYLLKSKELNVLIETLHDAHLGFSINQPKPANLGQTRNFIHAQVEDEMPKITERLNICLEREIW